MEIIILAVLALLVWFFGSTLNKAGMTASRLAERKLDMVEVNQKRTYVTAYAEMGAVDKDKLEKALTNKKLYEDLDI